jgi:hypothetical protein
MGSLFSGTFKIKRVGTGSMLIGGVQCQNNEGITYFANERTAEMAAPNTVNFVNSFITARHDKILPHSSSYL